MTQLNCTHCGNTIEIDSAHCSHCGIPLPPDFGKSPQKRFKLFFIAVILFCTAMIIWLPPNWID